MESNAKNLKYTSDLINEIMSAKDNGWMNLFEIKVASKWKERNKRCELSYKTKCEILAALGYEIKVKRPEDLWDLVKPKHFKIRNSAKDYGIIEAPNREKAIADLVKKEFPRKKSMEIGGVKYDMAEIFKTGLIIEEIK